MASLVRRRKPVWSQCPTIVRTAKQPCINRCSVSVSLRLSRPSSQRICCGRRTSALPCVLLRLCQTELPAVPTRSFCKAWCAWSCFSSGAATHHRNFVGNGTEDVEYQIIYDKCRPWTDHDNTYYQLYRESVQTPNAGGARTNIRVSHVSNAEKLAGRMDSSPIVCSSKV